LIASTLFSTAAQSFAISIPAAVFGPISPALAPAASVDWKPARWLIWPAQTGICKPSK